MQVKVVVTADGSHSLYVPEMDEHYHSTHGAIRESEHVFIDAGLRFVAERMDNINLLEVGFGTGLNCLLAILENRRLGIEIHYVGLEKHALSMDTITELNYSKFLGNEELLRGIHNTNWEEKQRIEDGFYLTKKGMDIITDSISDTGFDLVFFDAFGPRVQPEIWGEEVLTKIAAVCRPGACLVTYCSKGEVRRALGKIGFAVEKLPGPPGKREMVRAIKNG